MSNVQIWNENPAECSERLVLPFLPYSNPATAARATIEELLYLRSLADRWEPITMKGFKEWKRIQDLSKVNP